MKLITKFICSNNALCEKMKQEFAGVASNVSFVTSGDYSASESEPANFTAGVCLNQKGELNGIETDTVYYFNHYRSPFDFFETCKGDILTYKALLSFMAEIEAGTLNVSYSEYLFMGGQQAEVQRFLITRNGKPEATVGISGSFTGYNFDVQNGHIGGFDGYGYRLDNHTIQTYVRETILAGLQRDDLEYVQQFGLKFPLGYSDLTRDEVFADAQYYKQNMGVL